LAASARRVAERRDLGVGAVGAKSLLAERPVLPGLLGSFEDVELRPLRCHGVGFGQAVREGFDHLADDGEFPLVGGLQRGQLQGGEARRKSSRRSPLSSAITFAPVVGSAIAFLLSQ
jgi:hypothetical protein